MGQEEYCEVQPCPKELYPANERPRDNGISVSFYHYFLEHLVLKNGKFFSEHCALKINMEKIAKNGEKLYETGFLNFVQRGSINYASQNCGKKDF